jgi:hypothetical protein
VSGRFGATNTSEEPLHVNMPPVKSALMFASSDAVEALLVTMLAITARSCGAQVGSPRNSTPPPDDSAVLFATVLLMRWRYVAVHGTNFTAIPPPARA